MPELSVSLRRARIASLSGIVALVAACTLVVTPAAASEGSVPAEVSAYASAPDGLVSRLDDLFGGTGGIDFDDTTKVGQINRVFTFTEDFIAGLETETPVELANQWTAPVTIADKPVGLATIWINPASVQPELADFVVDDELTTLMSDVPAEAHLVRDGDRDAWFVLVDGQLTALVSGSSGISGPTPLAVYQNLIINCSSPSPGETAGADASPFGPAVVIALSILGIAVILLTPQLLARRRERAGQDADAEPVEKPVEKPAEKPVEKPAPKPRPKPKAQPKPLDD